MILFLLVVKFLSKNKTSLYYRNLKINKITVSQWLLGESFTHLHTIKSQWSIPTWLMNRSWKLSVNDHSVSLNTAKSSSISTFQHFPVNFKHGTSNSFIHICTEWEVQNATVTGSNTKIQFKMICQCWTASFSFVDQLLCCSYFWH